MKRKTIIAIIGRTSSGKTYIAKRLSTILGYNEIVSHTTRPMRKKETNGVEHWFDTKEEFQNVLDNQTVIAYTKIGEYEYCATLEDIEQDSIYVIDPNGLEYLKTNFGNELDIITVYIYCDDSARKIRSIMRQDLVADWEKRNKAEDRQFMEFEADRKWDVIIDNSGRLHLDEAKKRIRKEIERIDEKNGKSVY